ncbi:MAG: DUF1800 family protein [Planctomycetes bacterium]|nr:DUF1800 family protein [Planctomycetota bacterium]
MGLAVLRLRAAPRTRRALAVAGMVGGLGLAALCTSEARAADFRRGDVNTNGALEMADAIQTFGYLFLGSPTSLKCDDAADTNDDGKVDLSDGVSTLNFMFIGGAPPAAPGPSTCGPDPTVDGLTCAVYDGPGCVVAPTPPSAPTGLTATAGNGQVTLDWANNPEADVRGYNVYRSTTPGSGHAKLNSTLLPASSYIDAAVTNGTVYYYKVTAVDSDDEESPFSTEVSARPIAPSTDTLKDIGHVLNRLGFGPKQSAIDHIQMVGLEAYIDEQLHPETIVESSPSALAALETEHFKSVVPTRDTFLLAENAVIRYSKGTQAPPADWRSSGFDDASWLVGATGIGYGDGDDATVLADMRQRADDPMTPEDESQPGYASVYVRARFQVADLAGVKDLIFRVDYDDGFAAYLNGTEIARKGLPANPAFNALATSHDAGSPEDIDITARKSLLVAGTNVLAIQVHNTSLGSSDLTMIPEILSREVLPGDPVRVPKSIKDLQAYVLQRAALSDRQLQEALGLFWENHLTTDSEKVAEYFDALQNSDASDAMSPAQAQEEAAQVEYQEYKFFYDNALGNFGDLLLYSASSVPQVIYLDNVLNKNTEPNENYAREILELFAFGVDNRYTQKDIEQLAKCFTGWSVCKVAPDQAKPFPASAESPPTDCGVRYTDTVVLGLGSGWKYFKGTQEPSPDPATSAATTEWTKVGFNDAAWLNGSTGIGYGDGDDATVLSDMQGNYRSVYLRRTFNVTDPFGFKSLILEVGYDDGFIAYLNGVEVARSESLEDSGSPPAFNKLAEETHEVSEGTEYYNLNRYLGALVAGQNVLAIQVHNGSLTSSDLSMLPRLLDREILPGSVESGDRNGAWTFFFRPEDHDVAAKTLFQGTPYQINVPAGRTGMAGLRDALDVVKGMVSHPSTSEFICIKLIQKLVSDEISIQTKDTAPLYLRELLADMIAAWSSTNPKGNIRKVLEVLFDARDRQGAFWAAEAYRAKVKTPIELLASMLRLVDASVRGTSIQDTLDAMEMRFFVRDAPDGYPENGLELLSTTSKREGIELAQALAQNANAELTWNTLGFSDSRDLDTAQEIVDYFADLMYHGTLSAASKAILLEFLTTDQNGNPKTLLRSNTSDFQARTRDFLELLLSMPEWDFQ